MCSGCKNLVARSGNPEVLHLSTAYKNLSARPDRWPCPSRRAAWASQRHRSLRTLLSRPIVGRSKLLSAASNPSVQPGAPDTLPRTQQPNTVVQTAAAENAAAAFVTAVAAVSAKQQPEESDAAQDTVEAAATDAADARGAVAQRLAVCLECSGKGRIVCRECEGRGFLKRGGYNKKNPLNMSRITGSKWTAMQETLGWRHFSVVQQRRVDKHTVYLLLQASCDNSAQLWVNAQNLRNRSSWAAGWLQMSEIQGLGAVIQGAGHKCQSCAGLGFKACVACDGTGKPQLIVL